MFAIAPWISMLALGGLAASVPIILHFFYRSRYRVVPWAAMKFLLTSIEQTSRRVRFQELLLLVARVCVMLLLASALALALAPPNGLSGLGAYRGQAVDAVLVLDTSMSMAGREGSGVRLDQARQAALRVIDQLPDGSTVQVVRCSDRATLVGPRSPTDLKEARRLVEQTEVTDLRGDLLPGVQKASEALQQSSSPVKEVYFFSDMQANAWEQQGAIKARLEDVRGRASVFLVRCASRAPRNVSVLAIEPQAGVPHTGERNLYGVVVRNTGSQPVQNVVVTLAVDGKEEPGDSKPLASLSPGETQTVTLTARLDRAGPTVLSARVGADDLEADNRIERLVDVREKVRVLVVDGSPSERQPERSASFFVVHSLRPVAETAWSSYHVQPRVTTPEEAEPSYLAETSLCILANVPLEPRVENLAGTLSSEFLDRLQQFVDEGGTLLVFGGPQVLPDEYNRHLFEKRSLLPGPLGKGWQVKVEEPAHLDAGSADRASFLARYAEPPLNRIGQVDVVQALDLETSAAGRVLLRYSNGKPAVVSRRVGEGECVVVTTSADPRWTDWPVRPTYLPFLHTILNHALSRQSQGFNVVAGQPLRWTLPGGKPPTGFVLSRPDGSEERLEPPAQKSGRAQLETPEVARSGIYRIVPAGAVEGSQGVLFAVTYDGRETESLASLGDDEIDSVLGFKPVHVSATAEKFESPSDARYSSDGVVILLLGLTALVFAGEMVLAWMCGRAW